MNRLITKGAVKQVISDYWKQLRRYPIKSFFAIVLPGIGSIFVFYIPPLIVGKLVDNFTSAGKITINESIGYIALFGFGWLFGEVLWRIGLHLLCKVEERGINVLAKDSLVKLAERDYGFFSDNFVGTLAKKAFSYSRNFENIIDTLTFNVSSNIFPIFFAFIILWRYSFWIPLVLLGCIILIVSLALPIIRRRALIITERHDANSRMVGRLSDTLTNILTVKSFAKESYEYKTFGKVVDNFTSKFKQAADFQNLKYDTIVSPIYVATNVIGLVAAITFAQTLGLQAGAIVIVFSYYAQVTRIFWNINGIYRGIESSVSEAAEFTQLFLEPPTIEDSINASKLKVTEGRVTFSEVRFNYCNPDEKEVCFLNSFNLDIKPGQKVGLVGPSGGGKTTITKLLLRFIDTLSGDILIDGQKIKAVTQVSLREVISYVPQEPLLFHRSLYENIAYANDKSTKAEVLKAAKIAHADEFIDNLPKGYDSLVGERGIKLSGGQRQRVAIARALLKKAPILVLDEATSSLDSESEQYIQQGLKVLMKDKTAIVVAHRLSTIKNLDRIVVLDNGVIVQDGKHEDLIKADGLYKKLWDHQSGHSEVLE